MRVNQIASRVQDGAGLVHLESDQPGGASQSAPQPLPDQHPSGDDGGGARVNGGKGTTVKGYLQNGGFEGRIAVAH